MRISSDRPILWDLQGARENLRGQVEMAKKEEMVMKRMWIYDPHSGGVKIPESVRQRIQDRILAYAEEHYSGKYTRIDVRFRGQLCYIRNSLFLCYLKMAKLQF